MSLEQLILISKKQIVIIISDKKITIVFFLYVYITVKINYFFIIILY